jgi:hypothetical protein
MPGLVPGIHSGGATSGGLPMDCRDKPGNDEGVEACVVVAARRIAPACCQRACPLLRDGPNGPPQDEGMARRKAQTCGVRDPCGARRAPLGAPHALILVRYRASRYLSACSDAPARMSFAAFSFRHRASLSVTSYGRAISQLLAGTPNGPGRSSDAARVSCCDKTRGRRTPSRDQDASRARPLKGRGEAMIREVWRSGIRSR